MVSSTPPAFVATSPGPEALGRRTWAIALAVAAVAFAWRFVFANQRGFWLDEYFTLQAAQLPLADMIKDRLGAGHSPLYFFYARLGPLLGTNERAMRVTSALAAAAAVLLLTGLMGQLGLRRHLAWAWGLALAQPYWINIGMEYRYTMPLIAMALGTVWAAARHAERPTAGRGAVLALAVGLLLWTHGSAPFLALGLLAFLAWDGLAEGGGRAALLRVWPVLAGVALGAPFFYLVRGHHSAAEGQPVYFMTILHDLVEVVFGNDRLWLRYFHWRRDRTMLRLETVVLLGAAALAWLELRRQGNRRAGRLLVSTLLAVPLLLYLFCVCVRNFEGPPRYLAAFSIPALIVMAVAAGAATRPRPLAWLWRGALVALLIFQASAETLDRGDRHRDAVTWLIQNHQGRDPIVAAQPHMTRIALEFKGLVQRRVVVGGFDNAESQARTEETMMKQLAQTKRGLFIRYHARSKMLEAIRDLAAKKFFIAERDWRIGGQLFVGAFIRDEKERSWLENLQAPRLEWGPADSD